MQYCMRQVVALQASDLHMKAGRPPYLRLNGELTPIPGMYAVSDSEMERIVRELTRAFPKRLEEFEREGESDLAYELKGCGRFRVNVFRQRGKISIVFRVIPEQAHGLDKLNLPPVLETLAGIPRGLILVVGATGSGKSTTLAAIVDMINRTQSRHIVTIEDPIEVVHREHKSLINQREVGLDTGNFNGALRRALRQDPDVIMIGEMRDEETVRTALSAAETGHLVLSTLHTVDVIESVHRVLDFFPPALERQARSMLASTLKGIVAQRLVRTADGRSRVPAVEVLVGTSRVHDCILRPEETDGLMDAMAEGAYYGMQTFDQGLLQLVLDNAITVEEAMYHATSRQNFALLLEAHNVTIDKGLRKEAAGSVQDTQSLETQAGPTRRPLPPGAPGGAAHAGPPVPPAPYSSTFNAPGSDHGRGAA
jgi:twitching motility protein PilT